MNGLQVGCELRMQLAAPESPIPPSAPSLFASPCYFYPIFTFQPSSEQYCLMALMCKWPHTESPARNSGFLVPTDDQKPSPQSLGSNSWEEKTMVDLFHSFEPGHRSHSLASQWISPPWARYPSLLYQWRSQRLG